MSERKAVTKKLALEYRRAGKARKGQILDELCRLTDWHRNHARKALKQALLLKAVRPRPPRPPIYGPAVVKALRFLWAVQGTPCGRLLAAALPDVVPRLRRLGELSIDDDTAGLLLRIAPATIDRRLAGDRAGLIVRGRSHTKPGTLLKSSIPMRTWAEWDDAVPGFVEIDLVGHEGGNSRGEFCFTLDITDIATGWSETRSVRNKAQKWVFAAIKDVTASFPFPILGIDSDNRDTSGGPQPRISRQELALRYACMAVVGDADREPADNCRAVGLVSLDVPGSFRAKVATASRMLRQFAGAALRGQCQALP